MRSLLIIIAAMAAAVIISSCGSPGKKVEEPVRAAAPETAAAVVEPEPAAAEISAEGASDTAALVTEVVEAAAETGAESASVETPAAVNDVVTPDASFPTGEPLTMPAVIPLQHTAEAPRAEQPAVSGNQPASPAEQAPNSGSQQPGPGKQPPANRKAVIMQVVNCKEWISLRTMPSTSADTIARIPLGEKVVWIGTAENGFYQINYQGNTGYALAEYLVQVQ